MKILPLLLTFLCACRTPAAPPKKHSSNECIPRELRTFLSQSEGGKLLQQPAAVSTCRNRCFLDPRGRNWHTDAEGRVLIPQPLDAGWITPPAADAGTLDIAIAFWLFGQGHHFLGVKQLLSVMLQPELSRMAHQLFCEWWGRVEQEGGTWPKMMDALPLIAAQVGNSRLAASPKWGFSLELPESFDADARSVDADTTLFLFWPEKDRKNALFLLVSTNMELSVNEALRLSDKTEWQQVGDHLFTAVIEKTEWIRQDTIRGEHKWVWMAPKEHRNRLDTLAKGTQAFSMPNPCAVPDVPETTPETSDSRETPE